MTVEVKGKTYKNCRQAALKLGLKYHTVWKRLKAGRSVDEAFSDNGRSFHYAGKTYPSLKQAAEANGLDHRTVWNRLKSGKSIDEAFSKVNLPRIGQSSPIIINGETFPAVSVAARKFGISERTVHGRLERGLTPEQAVGIEPFDLGTEKSITVNGASFPSIASAARYFGIPIHSVHNRMKRGRSLEEVFFDGKLDRQSPRFHQLEVADLSFNTLKDACEYFDVRYQVARYRLRKSGG